MTEMLLDMGAPIYLKTQKGETAFHLACSDNPNLEIIKTLID